METNSITFNSDELVEKISLEKQVENLKQYIERLENTKKQLCEQINSLYCENVKYVSMVRDIKTKCGRVCGFYNNFEEFWKSVEEGKIYMED